ncbi:Leucine-, isoleucine-, valine-, threonine-, and alanine-binding protein [Tepidimonas sediminis]|uniref:Leucine-, isoleucine-, valine-, threonine-, and alanine-binding protein n=2 Tax=Tepidimonas sediminis TaxID=2588941 RepID=A0A554WSJ6_9BURK|nr:Leucine-, isoleucine-, valine-, threonine-, and alanine-binding protein [Tepidimonas sediminis]
MTRPTFDPCPSPSRRSALLRLLGGAAALALPPMAVRARGAAPVRVALIEALSGPVGNAGEAVLRNLVWACERVNARGGVDMGGEVRRPLQIVRFDSKGQPQEALSALQSALDDGITVVAQGNSSAVAAALIEAINRHNEREPQRQVVFLNYSAVDPVLTNERCSFWHFRFDAHADMRMAALMEVLRQDAGVKSVYLIGQDYSFGQAVLREARRQLALQRPDVRIAGEELHPLARIKDFIPYVTKIKASGAQAVITGNWGNDLTLLVRAARELGYEGKFYTFYGNALGAPAAIGEAGVGKVIAVADWFPNAPGEASRRLVEAFRQRFPNPAEDYIHLRMQLMIEALAQALTRAARAAGTGGPGGLPPAVALARALEQADVTLAGQRLRMRAEDHQAQQPLMVAVMERQGAPGVPFDVEGSGYGFRVLQRIEAAAAEQPHTCRMVRPDATAPAPV